MSSAARVAPDFRGASRCGRLKKRECFRLMRQVRRASEEEKIHENVVADWGPMTVGPDLIGVSAQAPQAPPINLVPPSSLETVGWEDVTTRCRIKAEIRAEGEPVPATRAEYAAYLDRKREEKQAWEEGRPVWKQPRPEIVQGSAGFTHKHRQAVRKASAVLSPYMGRLAMFTGTLCDPMADVLSSIPRGWDELIRAFRRELGRISRKRGLPDLRVDVTEIQLDRYAKWGIPVPHVHLVMVVRNGKRAGDAWLVHGAELQVIWDQCAAKITGLLGPGYRSRTELKAVKHDVYGYLSKYLSKGAEVSTIDWTYWAGLRPSRWWRQSDALGEAVKSATSVVPGAFTEWLVLNEQAIKRTGRIVYLKRFTPDMAPTGELVVVQFASAMDYAALVCAYERDVRRLLNHVLEVVDAEFDPGLTLGISVPARDLEGDLRSTVGVVGPGRVPDRFRESLEVVFRDIEIPEPVFNVGVRVPSDGCSQLEFLGLL